MRLRVVCGMPIGLKGGLRLVGRVPSLLRLVGRESSPALVALEGDRGLRKGGSVECVRMFVAEEGRRSVEVMAYSG